MPAKSGGLDVEFVGLKEALAKLEAKGKKARDLTSAFRRFDRESVRPFLDEQFQTAGAFGGHPWAPLKASTQKKRRRPGGNRGGVDHPLWDTGNLRSKLLNRPIRLITRDEYRRGTDVPYARHAGGPDTDRPIFPEGPVPVLEAGLLAALELHFAE